MLAIILGSVHALRSEAEAARATAIYHLKASLISETSKPNKGIAAQLEILLNLIENLQEGAFAPWSSQPVVRAFLLPLVTYGATTLAHVYALPGM